MRIESIKELCNYISSDIYRYIGRHSFLKGFTFYLTHIQFRFLVWLRICSYLKDRPMLFPFYLWSVYRWRRLSYRSGVQISYKTNIDKGFYIGHFGTMVINENALIGKNVNISPGINIGQANRGKRKGSPIIGSNVYIGPGAKIVGNVKIGNNVAIGANAVVLDDIPDNACVGGVPARVLSLDGVEGYISNKV
jgi:serine O-acetyltransferase